MPRDRGRVSEHALRPWLLWLSVIGLGVVVLPALSSGRWTQGSSERSELVYGVTVTGPDDFRVRTREAVEALDPTWFTLVTQSLTRIEYDANGDQYRRLTRVDPRTGDTWVTHDTAFGYDDDGYAGDSLHWYACGLVHEAHHVYQYQHSNLRTPREYEGDAIGVQAACLKKLGAASFLINYALAMRDCIDAGGCKYWETHRYY